jgi:hypothetical protein
MKKILTEKEGGSERNVISWNEFKSFKVKCAKKRANICEFLKATFDVDDDGRKNADKQEA